MTSYSQQSIPDPSAPIAAADTLNELFEVERRIVRTKLEVLAAEMHGRLVVHANNLSRVDRDKEFTLETFARLDVAARYHLREQSDKNTFYRTLFSLEQERRSQDVECWRDLVMVMRDFLIMFETHERAQAKVRMLSDV